MMSELPLPRRVFWPWNEPAERVGFFREVEVGARVRATLRFTASGDVKAWLDGVPLTLPEALTPSWLVLREAPVDLPAGKHVLALEATPGAHGQPFLLACLD